MAEPKFNPIRHMNSLLLVDVCSLPEGNAVLHCPMPLSAESLEEFVLWIDLIKRKTIRMCEASATPLHGESDISGDRAAVAQEKEQ